MLAALKDDVVAKIQPLNRAAPFREYLIAFTLTALVTVVAFILEPVAGHPAVALLYLLLVVVAGVRLGRGPVLFIATSSALLWDYLINPPYLSFLPGNFEDMMLFAMFFIVAIAMGHLTSRLRQQEIAERMREQRTAALYELVQQAGLAADLDSGLRAAIHLTETLFNVKAALLLRLPDHSLSAHMHPASSFSVDEDEYRAAHWAFTHREAAGRFTETFSDSKALHLPLQGRTAAMGVFAIFPSAVGTLDDAEKELLETFGVLIGAILEKDHLLQGLKQAEILRASEHLQRVLLQSVSHELKTPLSAIQTGTDALAMELDGRERGQATLREIQQALRRLHRVINNLLDMTRIEAGVVRTNPDWCDVNDLIQAAIDLAAENLNGHLLAIETEEELPIVKVDQALLEQCLCNLLLNAVANSAVKTKILIRGGVTGDHLIVSVLDEGKGIPEADLPRIFETFHRGTKARPGGTGLGLAFVDGFVRAHGGTVTAANRQPQGAEFVITIPVETLRPEELEHIA
jgi:two-component system sensor histidine kinase KdpD